MTIRKFIEFVSASKMEFENLELVPIRKLAWAHNRRTREFTTAVVRCVLRKRAAFVKGRNFRPALHSPSVSRGCYGERNAVGKRLSGSAPVDNPSIDYALRHARKRNRAPARARHSG